MSSATRRSPRSAAGASGWSVTPRRSIRELRHAADLLAAAPGVELAALFGPEHGFHGAGAGPDRRRRRRPTARFASTACTATPSRACGRPRSSSAGSTRSSSTCRTSAAGTTRSRRRCSTAWRRRPRIGSPVFVLDRPNPIGGVAVEGPALRPGFESFVGAHPIATRHGLTIGELARLYRAERVLGRRPRQSIPCEGWRRDMTFEETGLPWVLPSPNMPTVDTALVYPGHVPDRRDEPVARAAARRGRSSCAARRGSTRANSAARLEARAICRACGSGRRGSGRRSRSSPGRTAAACSCTSPTATRSGRCGPGLAVLAALRDLSGDAVRLADGGVRVRRRPPGHRPALRQRPRAAGARSRRAVARDRGGVGSRKKPRSASGASRTCFTSRLTTEAQRHSEHSTDR